MGLSETLMDWLGTFWRILISPTPKTFETEAEKADNKFGSVVAWAVVITLYSYLISALAGYIFDFTILIVGFLVIPLALILTSSATSFMLQRVFHRKQYLYDKILYIFTAIITLFQIIINPVTFFAPQAISVILNYVVIAYQLILLVIATKAIARVSYWQAIVTVLIAAIVGVMIFICTIPFIISLMGGVNRIMRQ